MNSITRTNGNEAQLLESVLLDGDLSKLSAEQRVTYYRRVCESIGLNPLTKPFDYIRLNNKLTLYAKKDATDQLRNIHGVSVIDVDVTETDTQFIVKVKGHNKDGRADVEIGVVNKTDMQGNTANAQMKAVTKAKRRLTLSLCGLGWLDETEIQSIPDARPVSVADNGEIVDAEATNGNPDPIDDKAWNAWTALIERAQKVQLAFPHVDRARTTKSDLRIQYKETEAYVRDAEEQAQAGEPA